MARSEQNVPFNIDWLIRLRWVATFGQLLTIFGAWLILGIALLIWPLLVVIGLTALSNWVLIYWFPRQQYVHADGHDKNPDITLGLVMMMDMLSLATLLYVTGGPTNPFCLFFFVNLSLAAAVLGRIWAWFLNVVSIICFLGLLLAHIPIDELERGLPLLPILEKGNWSLEQIGLLLAFATCSSVIVYFMTRVSATLRQREADLREIQEDRSRNEKLEALGTLAAGAAHELATPLTTIALVAKDVEQSLRSSGSMVDEDLVDDVGLIRQQLDRCKSILDRMSGHAGETVGEMMQVISMSEFVRDVRQGLTDCQDLLSVQIDPDAQHQPINVPVAALAQAIRGLIQNGLDASCDGNRPVETQIMVADASMKWTIRDFGTGMTPEVLRRISEPFFTTKQPGRGMGLGVFLARNVIERLGGSVDFRSSSENTDNQGTLATVIIPCLHNAKED